MIDNGSAEALQIQVTCTHVDKVAVIAVQRDQTIIYYVGGFIEISFPRKTNPACIISRDIEMYAIILFSNNVALINHPEPLLTQHFQVGCLTDFCTLYSFRESSGRSGNVEDSGIYP